MNKQIEDMIWAASYVDAYGRFTITRPDHRGHHRWRPKLVVVVDHNKIIYRLYRLFGVGCVCRVGKSYWQWEVSHSFLPRVLPYILPYLQSRKATGERMAAVIANTPSARRGEEHESYYTSAYEDIKKENKTQRYIDTESTCLLKAIRVIPTSIFEHEEEIEQEMEYAWAAGLIDGEGYIGILRVEGTKTRYSYSPQLTVSMTHKDAIYKLQHIFGNGHVSIADAKSEDRQLKYTWRSTHDTVRRNLKAIYPYMVTKRLQCQLALQYFGESLNKTRGQGNITEIEHIKRDDYYWAIRLLNQRGAAKNAIDKWLELRGLSILDILEDTRPIRHLIGKKKDEIEMEIIAQ